VGTMKKYNNYILDNRTVLKFTPKGQGDAQELFLNLLNKFCDEYPIFQFVRYHLFGFYRVNFKFCSNNHHSVTLATEYLISLPIDNCKDSNTLHSGIINSMKTVEIDEIDEKKSSDEKKSTDEESDEDETKRKCPYCMFKNIKSNKYKSFESLKYLHLPNILVIQLMRTNYVNSNTECDTSSIYYEQYMILPEGNLNIRYELIGLITYKGTARFGHYVAYILTSKNEWWLLDDLPKELGGETKPPQKVAEEEVYNQKKFAFLFFYRKLSEYNIATVYNSKSDYINNLEKIEYDIRRKIDSILIENENSTLSPTPAEQDITDEINSSLIEIHNNPSCTTTDISKLDLVESELFHELFSLIIPDVMDILKIKNIDIRFKDSMKQLYEEYSGIFENDSILEPISRTVVDLTESDDGDLVKKSKKALKKSPNKRKWVHVTKKKT